MSNNNLPDRFKYWEVLTRGCYEAYARKLASESKRDAQIYEDLVTQMCFLVKHLFPEFKDNK